jgi:hypothetical protein
MYSKILKNPKTHKKSKNPMEKPKNPRKLTGFLTSPVHQCGHQIIGIPVFSTTYRVNVG